MSHRSSLPGPNWFICLIACSLVCAAFAAQPNPAPGARPLPRITIMPTATGAVFTIKSSALPGAGVPLLLKGFDYVRRAGWECATFDAATAKAPANYDPQHAEAMLTNLQSHGFNIVRVFIGGRLWLKDDSNRAIAGDEQTQGVYEPYMANVRDFLRRAQRHGIYVLPAMGEGSLPSNRYYLAMLNPKHPESSAIYFTRESIAAKARYVADFLNNIKTKEPQLLSTIMGIECQSELNIKATDWPFSVHKGKLEMPNGKSYDMADHDQRWALMNESLRYYHAAIVRAVKQIDPEMLVAESVYPLAANNLSPTSHAADGPPDLVNLGNGALDFLDIHFYRKATERGWAKSFQIQMHSSRLDDPAMIEIRKTKPVILGEFGAYCHGRHYYYVEKSEADVVPDMVKVRNLALAAGLKGFLYWTYDWERREDMYTAMDDDGALFKALAK